MNQEESILGVIHGALALRTHKGLFEWLQKDVQAFLPHDIFIAAWGDFGSDRVFVDVVSRLPGMRTTDIDREVLQPFLGDLFESWVDAAYAPFWIALDAESCPGLPRDDASDSTGALARMRFAVVHGIKDERGWHDCLYVALSSDRGVDAAAVGAMEILLPSLDATFRRVRHLPMQRHGSTDDQGLTVREQEIMRWVSVGKTNPEIGQILDISPKTVRNHLQNIFRKLDVMNRAQAVFQLERGAYGKDGR